MCAREWAHLATAIELLVRPSAEEPEVFLLATTMGKTKLRALPVPLRLVVGCGALLALVLVAVLVSHSRHAFQIGLPEPGRP